MGAARARSLEAWAQNWQGQATPQPRLEGWEVNGLMRAAAAVANIFSKLQHQVPFHSNRQQTEIRSNRTNSNYFFEFSFKSLRFQVLAAVLNSLCDFK